MKKIQLILIIILLAVNLLTAQTSFKKIISIYDEQSPEYIIEGNSGNFVISASVLTNNERFNDIIKINKYGDIVKDTLILERKKSFNSIKFYNNYYYLIGDICDSTIFHNNPPYNMKIILTKLDTNLNLVKEDTIAFSTVKWISNQDFIIDSDSNIVIYGMSQWYIDSLWDIYQAPFLYKISLNGDSLSYKEPPVFEICDIKENTNNNEYYSLKPGLNSNFIKMDKNLTILQDTMISNLNDNLKMSSVNNDTLMIVGTASGELKAIIVDTINFHGLNSKTFAGNTCRKSFAYKNDNYFVLGMYSNIFRIYKLNLDLSIVWDKAVGGDANYNYVSAIIQATNDGGCIIASDRSDSDIYLVKIAPDGTIQWENEVPINANITIFPNPGNNFINIKSDKEYSQFEMFDISGKQVLSKTQQAKTINTQNLNSGIYIYKFIDKNNNVLKTGKWIKNN